MKKRAKKNKKTKFQKILNIISITIIILFLIFLLGTYLQKKFNIVGYASRDRYDKPPCKTDSDCNSPLNKCYPSGECKPEYEICGSNRYCDEITRNVEGEIVTDCANNECYCRKIRANKASYSYCAYDTRSICRDSSRKTETVKNENSNVGYTIDVAREHVDLRENNRFRDRSCNISLGYDENGKKVVYDGELRDGFGNDWYKSIEDWNNLIGPTPKTLLSQKIYLDYTKCCNIRCYTSYKAYIINHKIEQMKADAKYWTGKDWDNLTKKQREPYVRTIFNSNGVIINKPCIYCPNYPDESSGTCVGGLTDEAIWVVLGAGMTFGNQKFYFTGGTEKYTYNKTSKICATPLLHETESGSHWKGIAFDFRNNLIYPNGKWVEDVLLNKKLSDRDVVEMLGFPRNALELYAIDSTWGGPDNHYHGEVVEGFITNREIFDWQCAQTISDKLPPEIPDYKQRD